VKTPGLLEARTLSAPSPLPAREFPLWTREDASLRTRILSFRGLVSFTVLTLSPPALFASARCLC
jgi:hypothetical protein